MKKLITTAALLFILLLPLSAQAGWFGKEEWESEDCPKEHSLAWCLADYQGRSEGIHDMSQEEFVATLKKAGVDESHIGDILHDSLGVGLSMTNFAFGNLFGGSMFLMSALMPSYAEQNNKYSYIVLFERGMPQEHPENVIVNNFRKNIINAVEKALPTLPKEVTVKKEKEGILKILLPNQDCKAEFDCVVAYINNINGKDIANNSLPNYLGSSNAYSTRRGLTVGVGFYGLPKGVNTAMFAKNISENLPANMYWFIPTGYFGNNPFPMMLNHGKALFFVKPKAGDAIPVLPHVAAQREAEKKASGDTLPVPLSTSGINQNSSLAN